MGDTTVVQGRHNSGARETQQWCKGETTVVQGRNDSGAQHGRYDSGAREIQQWCKGDLLTTLNRLLIYFTWKKLDK